MISGMQPPIFSDSQFGPAIRTISNFLRLQIEFA